MLEEGGIEADLESFYKNLFLIQDLYASGYRMADVGPDENGLVSIPRHYLRGGPRTRMKKSSEQKKSFPKKSFLGRFFNISFPIFHKFPPFWHLFLGKFINFYGTVLLSSSQSFRKRTLGGRSFLLENSIFFENLFS